MASLSISLVDILDPILEPAPIICRPAEPSRCTLFALSNKPTFYQFSQVERVSQDVFGKPQFAILLMEENRGGSFLRVRPQTERLLPSSGSAKGLATTYLSRLNSIVIVGVCDLAGPLPNLFFCQGFSTPSKGPSEYDQHSSLTHNHYIKHPDVVSP